MLTLAAEGEEAHDLWRKKQPGNIGLTPEEEKLWLRAEARAVGWKGVLFEQTGMLLLGVSDGSLEILEVQPEGKKPMTSSEFMNGLRAYGLPIEFGSN